MSIAQTAVPNTSDDESMGITKLPVQILAVALEKEGEICKGECPVTVFRYPVAEGWIVGTVFKDTLSFAQSFVPDPDHIWPATLADDKTQPAPQQ